MPETITPIRKGKSVYDPQATADVKSNAIGRVLEMQLRMGQKNPIRVDMRDVDAVRETAARYVKACADASIMPNIEGFCAQLGISRRYFYKYLEEHPDTQTAILLDRIRTQWASARIALAERGVLDSSMVIFLTLNSSLGYTNEHRFVVEPAGTPLESVDAETARNRIVEALPGDDEA